jgi:hypothetical protein
VPKKTIISGFTGVSNVSSAIKKNGQGTSALIVLGSSRKMDGGN